MRAVVDTEKCIGCFVCEKVCRYNAIEEVDGKAHINENCIGCGACVETCPRDAISLTGVADGSSF